METRLIAGRIRGDNWQFEPTHKIFLATNHKPEIRDTDNAIWRRVRLIPFNVTIPDAEQDRQLPEKLKDEWTGILRWAVEWCLKLQQEELGLPKSVEVANQEYRSEMDILAPLIEDCCELGTGYEVKSNARYRYAGLVNSFVTTSNRAGEKIVVPRKGLEPSLPLGKRILSSPKQVL